MDIVPIYKRVIGLDMHQAKITGCTITEQLEGGVSLAASSETAKRWKRWALLRGWSMPRSTMFRHSAIALHEVGPPLQGRQHPLMHRNVDAAIAKIEVLSTVNRKVSRIWWEELSRFDRERGHAFTPTLSRASACIPAA